MTTPNQGGEFTPQPGQPTTPPPTTPPPSEAPAQVSVTEPGQAPAASPSGDSPLSKLMANRPVLIGGGVALAALVIGVGYLLIGGSSSNEVTSTQQLTANNPGANQVAGAPEGFKQPAPNATGRIVDTENLTVDRELADVTIAKVDPSTYAQIGEWWSRANGEGTLYLPPGKGLADVTFFSADDQTVPYTGQTTEDKGTVTSVTFERGIIGGFNLSPGAQVWYTDPSFQSDPAYILIPKGLEGTFQVYVDSAPVELAIP